MESKEQARRHFRAIRRALSEEERERLSGCVAEHALRFLESTECGYVFCYRSFGAELSTEDLISRLLDRGIKVAVPKVCGNEMIAVEIEPSTEYAPGKFGTSEPLSGKVVSSEEIAVIFAPLVSYGDGGKRLGQGGGYYDRFMKTQAITVGLAFSCQRGEFPVESHDVSLDAVITELGVEIFNENRCGKI